MKIVRKRHVKYIDVFRKLFKKTMKNYHLPSELYRDLELSVRDEKFQWGIVNNKYTLIDAILNRKNKKNKNILFIDSYQSNKTLYLIRICELLLEKGILTLLIPCHDFVFTDYSLENYFFYLIQGKDRLLPSSLLRDFLKFDELVILFDGYDEISENERKKLIKSALDLNKNHIQSVVASREIFEIDEEASFDYVYKQDFSQYKSSSSYQGINRFALRLGNVSEKTTNQVKKRNVSEEMHKVLALNLNRIFQVFCDKDDYVFESPEHLLGMIGIYLLDNEKNYLNYSEFRNISCNLHEWENKKIYATIRRTLLSSQLFFSNFDNNIIYFHQQLCDELVGEYLLICIKNRIIDSSILSKTFPSDIIGYIARRVKADELIKIFKFEDFNYIITIPCFWFDVLKFKYNFQLQQFKFNNIDFSNTSFSGCKFSDVEKKASFHNCKILDSTLMNVEKHGIVNAISKLYYGDLFATALSDKTIRIWKADQGCIQILEGLESIIVKLISCKNYLLGIGIDCRIYLWKRKEKYFEENYKILYHISDIIFNYDYSNAVYVQDDYNVMEARNKTLIYRSSKIIKLLSYVWNSDNELLITTYEDFLWLDLIEKRVRVLPNKYHISVNSVIKTVDNETIFIGYDSNRILLMLKTPRYDFKIHYSHILKDLIVSIYYSKKLNRIIAICKKGKIIILDLTLKISNSFGEIKGKITASDIYDNYMYIATNSGSIYILDIKKEGCFKILKKYNPLYDLNIIGCEFEGVQFESNIINEKISDNGGVVKNV